MNDSQKARMLTVQQAVSSARDETKRVLREVEQEIKKMERLRETLTDEEQETLDTLSDDHDTLDCAFSELESARDSLHDLLDL